MRSSDDCVAEAAIGDGHVAVNRNCVKESIERDAITDSVVVLIVVVGGDVVDADVADLILDPDSVIIVV